MDSSVFGRGRRGMLFDEDFDRPAPEPEVIAPQAGVLTHADLAVARADAWAEGLASARAEAAVATEALAQAAASLTREITTLRETLRDEAEANAAAIARLLLDTLAALFPALCARNGEAEARALVRALLPGLSLEPEIVVRACPAIAPALDEEIARAPPDNRQRVRVIADASMPAGDVRLRWHHGTATRDGRALWEEIAAVLAPAGLLSAQIRETADVE
jgi:flagellar biosynthesis/type III secretory pathway protein FliH